MARFLDGGALTFDSLAYSRPHPNTQRFLESQFERPSAMLSEAGQQFMSAARSMYEKFGSSEAMRKMQAAGRAVRSLWQRDEIRPLRSIGDFQHAPVKMQRYLMAEPTTRQMYIDQRCDGYSDTYVDVDPGTIGPAHYDYRRATDGLLMDSPTPDANGDYGWTAVTYMEELLPDDVELTLSEQVDIQYSWQWLKAIMAEGEQDPVSRYNADLT